MKNGEIAPKQMAPAVMSMKQLNRLDLPTGLRAAVHAATDVTGFGLLGHALHVADGSAVTLEIEAGAVPLLAGARETLARGIIMKAHGSNTRYVAAEVSGREQVDELAWLGLVDPQTSGGLLLSVAPEAVEVLLKQVTSRFPQATVIGEVLARGATALKIR